MNAAYQVQTGDSFIAKSTLPKECPLLAERPILSAKAEVNLASPTCLTWEAKLLFLVRLDVLVKGGWAFVFGVKIETR